MTPLTVYVVQTLLTLLGVVVLAAVILGVARRTGRGPARGPLELVGRLPLDRHHSVFLVRVADQILVLGSAEQGMTKLGEFPADRFPALDARGPMAWKEILNSLRSQPGDSERTRTTDSIQTQTKAKSDDS